MCSVISAELPDRDQEPELWDVVTKCMLHGPCGAFNDAAPCMIDGKCSKRYPKEFASISRDTAGGYPTYRRRDNGRTFTRNGKVLDNRWVVPYNPALCKKYNCHINVEYCASVAAIKYLHKYIYKGYDRAQVQFVPAGGQAQGAQVAGQAEAGQDEIKSYLDGRYVSSIEAAWRLLEFPMHDTAPAVYRLGVHLQDEQTVTYPEDAELEQVLEQQRADTNLQAWFKYNANHTDAHGILFGDMPATHSFDKQAGVWSRRVRHMKLPTVGRMYFVMPTAGERYYLRLLLNHVRGASSYAALKTVNGRVHETFQAAASALGLLPDDMEVWRRTIREATHFSMPSQLRQLFANLLLYSQPEQPRALWDEFARHMSEDYIRAALGYQAQPPRAQPPQVQVQPTQAQPPQVQVQVQPTQVLPQQVQVQVQPTQDQPPQVQAQVQPTQVQPQQVQVQPTQAQPPQVQVQVQPTQAQPPQDPGLAAHQEDAAAPLNPSAAGLTDAEFEFYEDQALRYIQQILEAEGKRLEQFGLRQPPAAPDLQPGALPFLIQQHTTLEQDRATLHERVQRDVQLLNVEQSPLVTEIMGAVEANDMGPSVYFVDAPGGCGKTFTFNLLLAAVRSQGHVALAVATSGIAALLLDGGTTAHSRFKLPLEVFTDCSCNLTINCPQAELIKAARLIVWDEAPMCHRHNFEALDKLLRDIMKTVNAGLEHVPFGGKVVVMAGDFRQILPVVRRGTKADIIDACLTKSALWQQINRRQLTINMRVRRLLQEASPDAAAQAAEAQRFSDFLMDVGNGVRACAPVLTIPDSMRAATQKPEDLITTVFGDLAAAATDEPGQVAARARLITRAILTPRNDHAHMINDMVMSQLPGQEHVYNSADSLSLGEEGSDRLYPTEFLNSLTPQGMPPSTLRLKVGMPVMLLRNLNSAMGLANGTRLLITHLGRNNIQADIMTGPRAGDPVLICRMRTTSSDASLPFNFTRQQFPIRPAFAMTINKAQGQTFERVGIYLPSPCFSHGQLYVALSRVGNASGITVMAVPQRSAAQLLAASGLAVRSAASTDNVVFHEVLQAAQA